MLDMAQPRTARHQQRQLDFGAIGRAVVDVDDLERQALAERHSDLGNQRRNVAALVPHRDDDGNGRPGFAFALFAHDDWTRSLGGMARASYGATSCRATLLTRAKDGPGSARQVPSAPGTKPSRRAASHSRTSRAPTRPKTAPASTSLGWCAVSATRLTAIVTA